jgi:DNA-binding response OmpR family regulator
MKHEKLIIFVDDDADDRMLVRDAFPKSSGYILLTLQNGMELFGHLADCKEGHYPCLIILDINMPRLSGWDIIDQLRCHDVYCTIPLYVYSTDFRLNARRRALNMGIPYLEKPMIFEELVEAWEAFIYYCNTATIKDNI